MTCRGSQSSEGAVSPDRAGMFASLREEYRARYHPGPELWNPLHSEQELWHRIRLFEALRWGLRHLAIDVKNARVLDVGCGMGQSTRMLLEFGVQPPNVLGIDLLDGFASYAQTLNPALRIGVVGDVETWPSPGQFDLCMQCTAFSSIKEADARRVTAAHMEDMIVEGGRLFWWDSLRTQPFAGGAALDPRELFKRSRLIGYREVCLRPSFAEACQAQGSTARVLCGILQRIWGFRATHRAAVFERRLL